MTSRPGSPAGLSFERELHAMFREKDHDSTLKLIDVWSYSDVGAYKDAILSRLREGTIPCDGAWPPQLRQWMAGRAG